MAADCAIVGAAGFLGRRLTETLESLGSTCVRLDVVVEEEGIVGCDLSSPRCFPQLVRSFQGVRCVFLVASYGMSGAQQLNKPTIRAVNVDGCRRVIDACLEARVPRLVYTSSYNAVFFGKPIRGLDETDLPYPDPSLFCDEYSRTKSMAERMVLEANGAKIKTVALRSAAIWGFGEERHMARVNHLIDLGLFRVRFGDNPVVDFVHIDNLVQAHVRACERLSADPRVEGAAFFVNDGEDLAVDNFEWFAQLKRGKGMGGAETLFMLPFSLVYGLAIVCELVYLALGVWYPFMLTRAEVLKSGVEHHVSIKLARQHLGYDPEVHSFDEVIEQWTSASSREKYKNE